MKCEYLGEGVPCTKDADCILSFRPEDQPDAKTRFHYCITHATKVEDNCVNQGVEYGIIYLNDVPPENRFKEVGLVVMEPLLLQLNCTGCHEPKYYPVMAFGDDGTIPNLDDAVSLIKDVYNIKSFKHTAAIYESEKHEAEGLAQGYKHCGEFIAVRFWRAVPIGTATVESVEPGGNDAQDRADKSDGASDDSPKQNTENGEIVSKRSKNTHRKSSKARSKSRKA